MLLVKLESIGLHAGTLKWLASYLADRTQFVRINNFKSDAIKATSGVPQGSHLGPLLFLIFVNDIPDVFLTSRCLMYADDLKIYSRIENASDCIKLQDDLIRLQEWCDANSLPLNVGKCQYMSFSRRKVTIDYHYRLGSAILTKIYEKKDLGVIFSSKMSFSKHIDFMVTKSRSMLGFVTRNSNEFRDLFTLKSLYFSFVRSNLEYCSIIWDPFYSGSSLRIEKVQKRFTRYAIHSLHWNCSMPDYKSRCLLLALPTLEMRRKISSVMFIRDIVTSHINCHFLLELILFNCPARDLRFSDMFHLPYCKTNFMLNEPLTRCLRQTNQVCKNLDVFSNSRESFKSKLNLRLHFLNCN